VERPRRASTGSLGSRLYVFFDVLTSVAMNRLGDSNVTPHRPCATFVEQGDACSTREGLQGRGKRASGSIKPMEEARGRSPSQGVPRRTRRWMKALKSSSGDMFFGAWFSRTHSSECTLIGHRGATSQKLLGALAAASRELGEAPSRAALLEHLRMA